MLREQKRRKSFACSCSRGEGQEIGLEVGPVKEFDRHLLRKASPAEVEGGWVRGRWIERSEGRKRFLPAWRLVAEKREGLHFGCTRCRLIIILL